MSNKELNDIFHPIDIAVADELSHRLQNPTTQLKTLICYLSAALRKGHLCVKLVETTLSPAFEDLDLELSMEENQLLKQSIIAAAASLPNDSLIRDGSRIYFKKQWNLESRFLKRLKNLANEQPHPSISTSQLIQELNSIEKDLLPEQRQAIISAINQSVTLITGGPGTGKTYTAARLLRILKATLDPDASIVLAAPTGKAAANLQRSLTAAFEEQRQGDLPKATTLHSLLKNDQPLSADIIIVDECSMIDVEMMVRLLEAVKPGARLIMLGDPQQLPPVEAGGLFTDLAQSYPTNHLKTCRRAELKSILELAAYVNEGRADEAIEFLKKQGWIKLLKDPKDLLRATERHFKVAQNDPESLLEFYNHFRILTPMRQGPWGSDSINTLFKQALMDFSAPVMISKNDHDLGLFNGEVGVLIIQSQQNEGFFQEGDAAYFPAGNSLRSIPAILLPKFEYAYGMSVHKSQGSEFAEIHVVLPEGAEIFGREVLYTAITRASKGVTIWSTEETLRKTINKQSIRHSGVTERYL